MVWYDIGGIGCKKGNEHITYGVLINKVMSKGSV